MLPWAQAYADAIVVPSGAAERDRADRLERLLQVGRTLTPGLDLAAVLDEILAAARDLTGARYAALGVLDRGRSGLAQFVTAGIDEQTRAAISGLPRGRGILGLLIDRPEPLRIHDIARHPSSFGFPAGHPPMRTFVGVPITIGTQVWGNLYLTEKVAGADFDDDDVDTLVVLAEHAAMAIENARLSSEATAHRHDLDRALLAASTAVEIANAAGSDTDLPRTLELIVRRGLPLVKAGALLIWLRHGDELRVAAAAGDADVPADCAIAIATSTAGEALRAMRTIRVQDVRRMGIDPSRYGVAQTGGALIVPLVHRGRGLGVLMAFGRLGATAIFADDDQRQLESFAAIAAMAVAAAHGVEKQRLRDTMAVAESERRRWARELHDETLQSLASLKLTLASGLTAGPDRVRGLLESAVAQLERDIAGLRNVIADLRPAALDELGLEPALRTLVARVARDAGLQSRVTMELDGVRLEPDIETIAYRVAQEALTNVVKHAEAGTVAVALRLDPAGLRLTITDDGRGVGAGRSGGYGIVGMRERAELASGTLEITPLADAGTCVTLALPLD